MKVKAHPKSAVGQVVELVVVVAVAVGLAITIQALLIKPFKIPSESMVPTLVVGERVLVNRLGDRFSEPGLGDIVVFHPPAAATGDQVGEGPGGRCGVVPKEEQACERPTSRRSEQNFIKRVVGLPGDTIAVVDGRVIRNGRRQREAFVQGTCATGTRLDFPTPITVPKDHWFMMGDNRQCSEDSRYWGPVRREWIIGGAFATYWPPNRLGTL